MSDGLRADYFDGRSAEAHAVRIALREGALMIDGEGIALRVPLQQVRWPERQRHGVRSIVLPNGATLRCTEAAAFDTLARAAGAGESITVRVQQSWRLTLVSVGLLLMVVVAGYRWGLPAAAHGVLAFVPHTVDERLGNSAYESIAPWLLEPSRVPPERQQRLRHAFDQMLARAHAGAPRAPARLHFHAAPRIGPNAFALPGGTIVITDELLARLDRDEVVLGVLAHEFGHVQRRHGMRLLVQTTLLAAATSVAFGDFSGLLAGAPALLGELGYSRDLEREADDHAIATLQANGISPLVMVSLFEAMARPARPARAASAPEATASAPDAARNAEPASGVAAVLGIAFSSHPPDAQRIERFRAAAARR
jgi:Zn-dependent protease with chaperone function